jgi:hypothetical protein
MARQQASTTARGYGAAHTRLRRQLLARWKPGDPCARCGRPMLYRWMLDARGRKVSAIDLGHVDGDKTRYTGLEHVACNRGAGARQANRLRKARRRARRTAYNRW